MFFCESLDTSQLRKFRLADMLALGGRAGFAAAAKKSHTHTALDLWMVRSLEFFMKDLTNAPRAALEVHVVYGKNYTAKPSYVVALGNTFNLCRLYL